MKFFTLRKSALLLAGMFCAMYSYAQTPTYEFAFGSKGDPIPLGSSGSKTSYSDYRSQFLYLPGKFTPSTPGTGTITTIYFKIASKSVATTYTNFKVSIGNTSLKTLTSYVTGLTQAVNSTSKSFPAVAAGDWLKIELTTPVAVDFSQPIVVDISQDAMGKPPAGYDIMTDAPLTKGNVQLYSTPASSTKATGTGTLYRFGFDLLTCSTSVKKQPVDAKVCESQMTDFTMEGVDVDDYQWQVDAGAGFTNLTDNGTYTGTKTKKLVTSGTPVGFHNNIYRCIVTKNSCEDTTDEVVMQVDELVNLQAMRAKDTTCVTAVKDLIVTGSGDIQSYKWQRYVSGVGFVDVPNGPLYSEMGNILRINGVPDTLDGARFRCVVDGTCNTKTSTELTLSVTPIPHVAASPRDTVVKQQSNVFFVIKSSSSNAHYQWQAATPNSSFVNLNDGGIYQGVNTSKLSVNSVVFAQNNFRFRCVLSGSALCGAPGDTSEFAILTVERPASIENINAVAKVVLYPNPANSSDIYLSTDISLVGRDTEYKVIDKTGRVVATGNVTSSNTKIDVSKLAADVYLVQITNNGKVVAHSKFTRL